MPRAVNKRLRQVASSTGLVACFARHLVAEITTAFRRHSSRKQMYDYFMAKSLHDAYIVVSKMYILYMYDNNQTPYSTAFF